MDNSLDNILDRISLVFSSDSIKMVIPEGLLAELSLYRIANIDTVNLDRELVFQSKVFVLFEALLSYVSDKYNRVESLLKKTESILSFKYESVLVKLSKGVKESELDAFIFQNPVCRDVIESGGRVSDKKIEKLVVNDPVYGEAVEKKLYYKNMVTIFNNILKGLEKRNDMLIQLAAKRKREMDGGIV